MEVAEEQEREVQEEERESSRVQIIREFRVQLCALLGQGKALRWLANSPSNKFILAHHRKVVQVTHTHTHTPPTVAVTLPIVCVAVIVFFVIMAVIAHVRYPHVSFHGQKRHRQKP